MSFHRSFALLTIAGLLLAAGGCRSDSSAHARTHEPPSPGGGRVKPFAISRPEAVLLVTGGTNGKMELCNCSGPMPGGLARRSGLIRSYRAKYPGALVIDVGDSFWIQPESVRNDYVMRGMAMVGYDVICLGDQEWATQPRRLGRILREADVTPLSTTVRDTSDANVPLRREATFHRDGRTITVLSNLQQEWLLFFSEQRLEEMAFADMKTLAARTKKLKDAGHCVIIVAHGDDEAANETAETCNPDLILRGHTSRTEKKPRTHAGVPILKIGHPEMVSAVALDLTPSGRVKDLGFRVEIVTEDWPMDFRLIQLYQAFVHVALRSELDHARKFEMDYVSPESCAECHQPEYASWKSTPHGRSYASVGSAGRGDDQDCLKCHTTGHGRQGGFVSMGRTPGMGAVTCQACHRVNLEAHKANPTDVPPAGGATCGLCHTPITSPGFSADKAIKAGKGIHE
jgi:hypothetical protein